MSVQSLRKVSGTETVVWWSMVKPHSTDRENNNNMSREEDCNLLLFAEPGCPSTVFLDWFELGRHTVSWCKLGVDFRHKLYSPRCANNNSTNNLPSLNSSDVGAQVCFRLWDSGGLSIPRVLTYLYPQKCHALLLVFDATGNRSVEVPEEIVAALDSVRRFRVANMPVILVGVVDESTDHCVGRQSQVREVMSRYRISQFFSCSVFNGARMMEVLDRACLLAWKCLRTEESLKAFHLLLYWAARVVRGDEQELPDQRDGLVTQVDLVQEEELYQAETVLRIVHMMANVQSAPHHMQETVVARGARKSEDDNSCVLQ